MERGAPDRGGARAGCAARAAAGLALKLERPRPGTREAADLGLLLVVLCFAAPVSYAVLVLLLARKLMGLSLPVRVGLITLGASVILVPTAFLGILASAPLPAPELWLGMLGLVVVCGVIPQFATTIGIPLAGADRAAIAGAIELLVALLAGWVLLGEAVTSGQAIGAALIGSAVLLARS